MSDNPSQHPEGESLNSNESGSNPVDFFDPEYLLSLSEEDKDMLDSFYRLVAELNLDIAQFQINLAFLESLISIELDLRHLRKTQAIIRKSHGNDMSDLARQADLLSGKIEVSAAILSSLGCCNSGFYEKFFCKKFFPKFFDYAQTVDKNAEVKKLLRNSFFKAMVIVHDRTSEEYICLLSDDQYSLLIQIISSLVLVFDSPQISEMEANLKFLTDQEVLIRNGGAPQNKQDLASYRDNLQRQADKNFFDLALLPNVARFLLEASSSEEANLTNT